VGSAAATAGGAATEGSTTRGCPFLGSSRAGSESKLRIRYPATLLQHLVDVNPGYRVWVVLPFERRLKSAVRHIIFKVRDCIAQEGI
jgi:hypothetical protein